MDFAIVQTHMALDEHWFGTPLYWFEKEMGLGDLPLFHTESQQFILKEDANCTLLLTLPDQPPYLKCPFKASRVNWSR